MGISALLKIEEYEKVSLVISMYVHNAHNGYGG